MKKLLRATIGAATLVTLALLGLSHPNVAVCEGCDPECRCLSQGNTFCSGPGCFESGCEKRWLADG